MDGAMWNVKGERWKFRTALYDQVRVIEVLGTMMSRNLQSVTAHAWRKQVLEQCTIDRVPLLLCACQQNYKSPHSRRAVERSIPNMVMMACENMHGVELPN